MNVETLAIPEVKLLTPARYADSRGFFSETWNAARFDAAGVPGPFVQDNHSVSAKTGTIRGLHCQVAPSVQGKLVRVVKGAVWDVAVDIRVGSPTFGKWVGRTLSAEDGRQMYIPPGYAHGFLVTSSVPAIFTYKCTTGYDPAGQCSILWNDPDLGIDWPTGSPLLSPKDAEAPRLRDVPESRLPRFEPSS
jgi:dTDP-4-dehydrorhamnose 3,5-epimerase